MNAAMETGVVGIDNDSVTLEYISMVAMLPQSCKQVINVSK